MTRPLDRNCRLPRKGVVDEAAGEFWVENPFMMLDRGQNLSAYERNRLYLNHQGHSFLDASFASAADLDADSRSVIAADFTRDGAIDLLVASAGGGPLRLLENAFPTQHHWLRLELIGTISNRSAIGTRVTVELAEGRKIVRDLFPANGCMGSGPAELLIGLGNEDRIARLTIRWPTGKTQTLSDVATDQLLRITEE